MTYTKNVLRLKTAKAIVNRCYEADKSAAMFDELSIAGNSITAIAIKAGDGWDVTINSSVYELETLKSFVTDVFNDIQIRKHGK